MSILSDYKISFRVQKIHNTNFKFIDSVSPSLDAILFEFGNVIHCDALLEVINLRISNAPQSEDVLYTTQGLQMIKIGYSVTRLYHDVEVYDANPNTTSAYSLPTADFKEIVKAWRNFITNGSSGLLT